MEEGLERNDWKGQGNRVENGLEGGEKAKEES